MAKERNGSEDDHRPAAKLAAGRVEYRSTEGVGFSRAKADGIEAETVEKQGFAGIFNL